METVLVPRPRQPLCVTFQPHVEDTQFMRPQYAAERRTFKCVTDGLDSQPFLEEKLLGAWKHTDYAQGNFKALFKLSCEAGLEAHLYMVLCREDT